MKKLLSLVFVLILLCSFVGCDFLNKQTCKHEYVVISTTQPNCIKEGEVVSECSKCNKIEKEKISALGHSFGAWLEIEPATEVFGGLQKRTCEICGEIETGAIKAVSYIDLSLIKQEFDSDTTYTVNKFEELSIIFQTAVINLSDHLKCKVAFEIDDFNKLLDDLVKECGTTFNFSVGVSMLGSEITFEFEHASQPTKRTEIVRYTQLDSVNYIQATSNRSADFNGFKINKSPESFVVKTSEQLFYALERGVRPICVSESSAERVYSELKKILIEIVDDSMSDYQKVRAIHDYLIMTVTYDAGLYDLLKENAQDLHLYNGFFMEGALIDKLAVCEGMSKSFTSLCNIEGIPCVTVTGYQTENPSGAGHAWNKVYVDGSWYIIDVTSDGVIVNEQFEVLSYKYFLISEQAYKAKYTGEYFTNILCSKDYDAYKNSSFSYKNQTHDYIIKSQAELDTVIGYFESFNRTNITVEFKIDFNYGDSVNDEIAKAYDNNDVDSLPPYTFNDNIYTLIKRA